MSKTVACAMLDVIRQAGFHVGHTSGTVDGLPFAHVDAADARTGERWSVNAATMYAAAVELAQQLRFDLRE